MPELAERQFDADQEAVAAELAAAIAARPLAEWLELHGRRGRLPPGRWRRSRRPPPSSARRRRAARRRSASTPTPGAPSSGSRPARARPGGAQRSGSRSARLRVAVLAVDQERAHPERDRALDVVLDRVADHRRLRRLDPEQRRARPGRSSGAASSSRARARRSRSRRRARGARRSRAISRPPFETRPSLSPCARSSASTGTHVVVEVEVLRVLPEPGHLDREVARRVRVAAHPADDPLGEREPELLVVAQLGMPLERLDRGRARLGVARRVELEPVALAEPPVALGAEVRPRLGEREVDVEENRPQGHDH